MKKFSRLFTLIVLFGLVALSSSCIFHPLSPTEIGVRTRKLPIFGPRGVDPEVFAPGQTHILLPYINDWNMFDTKLQNIEMTIDRQSGDLRERDDLLFKTIDGNDISLDVIISFRIIAEKAPYILQYVAKDDTELRNKLVRVLARSIPRDFFGELKTEDFYIAERRSEKAEAAKAELNRILNEYGVQVERVFTKDYRFNEAYQKAIEDKKVADQKTQQFISANNAKLEENKRKLEQAQGEVNKMVAKADGEYEKAKITADAYYEQQLKIAKAIIAEGQAEAKGIRKMNEALAGTGGAAMVKLKIAENLKGKQILMLPSGSGSGLNLQTMDMNQLLKVYGVKSMKESKEKK